jgi:methylenetetrahydrofolate dehydrogenase (NADP+) / methenyltetrahydrofolate cyclohydrolase
MTIVAGDREHQGTAVGTGAGARILSGRALAEDVRLAVSVELESLRRQYGPLPGLSVVCVGDDPASAVYARRILKNARSVGVTGRLVALDQVASTRDVVSAVERECHDPGVAGIIVQMPLPTQVELLAVIRAIDPTKDIDGIHPANAGLLELGYSAFAPSCARASVEILRRHGFKLAGLDAVVIGRSNVVGKPAHLLLMREHATVTVCHRQTRDLAAAVRRADVIVVAAGSPGLVHGDMVKTGAIVVDCGITVVDGTVVGDVDEPSVSLVASALTPVPGGVGPLTNAILLEHFLSAARSLLTGVSTMVPVQIPGAPAEVVDVSRIGR